MAMAINASIMTSQPAAMIPQAQVSDASRIAKESQNQAENNRITAKSSEPLNSIPSRSVPTLPGSSPTTQSTSTSPNEQTQQERSAQQQIENVISQLKARDREVRVHEQAHLSAAGQYATGGASYSYQTGPDGKRYAIGGEVGIDTSPIANDPEATLQKAMVVQQAALAPAQPSTQDMRVASAASQMMAEARAQIAEQQRTENDTTDSTSQASETDNLDQNNGLNSVNQIVSQDNQSNTITATSASNSASQSLDLQQLAMTRNQFETRLTLSGAIA